MALDDIKKERIKLNTEILKLIGAIFILDLAGTANKASSLGFLVDVKEKIVVGVGALTTIIFGIAIIIVYFRIKKKIS